MRKRTGLALLLYGLATTPVFAELSHQNVREIDFVCLEVR